MTEDIKPRNKIYMQVSQAEITWYNDRVNDDDWVYFRAGKKHEEEIAALRQEVTTLQAESEAHCMYNEELRKDNKELREFKRRVEEYIRSNYDAIKQQSKHVIDTRLIHSGSAYSAMAEYFGISLDAEGEE